MRLGAAAVREGASCSGARVWNERRAVTAVAAVRVVRGAAAAVAAAVWNADRVSVRRRIVLANSHTAQAQQWRTGENEPRHRRRGQSAAAGGRDASCEPATNRRHQKHSSGIARHTRTSGPAPSHTLRLPACGGARWRLRRVRDVTAWDARGGCDRALALVVWRAQLYLSMLRECQRRKPCPTDGTIDAAGVHTAQCTNTVSDPTVLRAWLQGIGVKQSPYSQTSRIRVKLTPEEHPPAVLISSACQTARMPILYPRRAWTEVQRDTCMRNRGEKSRTV